MSLEPLLEMQGISKTFNGLRVLKNVGLKVYPGEIHALMGENGAGKSTLRRILSCAYQADPGGEIRIAGQLIPTFDPATAKALGIAVIYQELSLCRNLSVAENIYLGRELRRGQCCVDGAGVGLVVLGRDCRWRWRQSGSGCGYWGDQCGGRVYHPGHQRGHCRHYRSLCRQPGERGAQFLPCIAQPLVHHGRHAGRGQLPALGHAADGHHG